MEGQRLSHYEVLERLGGGGMGVVYKALDTRLDRAVALKFLPAELTRDDEARTRFIQEARAASALDHPNICTIHEVDSTPEGQMFIAMAFYDGETLKRRIDRGPLPIDEALDIATQIAQGLTKAHSAGIVHRDIKPANIMLTGDGFAKILDFGIAKLLGVTGPTQVGSTLGTVSYMSPEQVAGEDADPRSDVWALGALLYEMLTGQVPFRGESQWAVMNSIANAELVPILSLRPEIPVDVESAVVAALQKDRAKRTRSAEELRHSLEACRARLAGRPTAVVAAGPAWRTFTRPAVALPVIAVAVVLALWAGRAASQRSQERWAREEALPQMLAFIGQDDYTEALALAEQVEAVLPNDPALADAIGATAVTAPIVTEPSGAEVYVRTYDDPEAEWHLIGRSPIEAERLPLYSAVEIRVEKEGFDPTVVASGVPGFYFRASGAPPITLHESGSLPPEMVFVPGGDHPVRITGFNSGEAVHLDPFLIDRYEVTNAEYKQFVDAGGYQDQRYWEGLDFVDDGRRLSWEEASAAFVDQTGRPGPSTWAFGTFTTGEDDYPVSGVSWYEAVAYTRFRGKSLPTIYHWARAALEPHSNVQIFPTHMLPMANFNGDGPRAVAESSAMGPHGTFDTAGNVKEWAWNASGEHRWLLGGAWDDEQRMYSVRFTSPPFDRSSRHGFRGVRYIDGEPDASLEAPVDAFSRDYNAARPVSDAVYQAYRSPLLYVPGELNARVEADDTQEDWRRIKVTMDAGYANERMSVYLFLPKNAAPPYQAGIYFPGLGAFASRATGEPYRTIGGATLDVVHSGRALVIPVWNGSQDRWDDFDSQSGEQYQRSLRTKMAEWTEDLGRTIDYLETRDDIDADRIFYYGTSFGSSTSLPLLDLEPRLKAALLTLPGYTYRQVPPEMDAVNYAPHVTMPVLMIGGRDDYVFPVETAQRPLFEQLGTPAADKRHLLYPMGHGPIPGGQFRRDVFPWLDKYLGPVR